MKSRKTLVFGALVLSLAAGSSTDALAQKKLPKPKSPPAPSGAPSAAPAPADKAVPSAAEIELLVEIAAARTLPAGLDESSPELAKIVALVQAGKTKAALPLIASYAKANKDALDDAAIARTTAWIVRRGLLLPYKELYAAADQLRYAKQGQLTLKKYKANLTKKGPKALSLGFVIAPYADGADAVKHDAKEKAVAELYKEIDTAASGLAAKEKSSTQALQLFKLLGEILSNVSKTRAEISQTFARNARA